ncbi:3-oxoacyl-(acyl carrier protein) synthase [Marinomonas sp. MED121]|nr:3-oxoacyl-(acyl carrier protein) synthase [Marinomonas sp. MED121]
MGLVSPLGCGVDSVWQKLIKSESGIRLLDESLNLDASVTTRIGGQVPIKGKNTKADEFENALNEADYMSAKERRRIDLFTLFALVAADEALTQANWQPTNPEDQDATATLIATGIGGLPTITHAKDVLEKSGARKISAFTVPAFLANLAAGNVSIKYGFKGPIGTPVTACAAGIQAIGDGMRLIRSGEAKVALVGGAEACIDSLSFAGFGALKALSTNNENPQAASRPFDENREGFVMGEGAGLLVIETLEHALARGATPLAEIVGYGTSADAYHLTSGPESGEGAARAMKAAMKMAALTPNDIGYVNAHATSTPVGDRGEINALRSVFSENVRDGGVQNLPISATKSATGHLLGAAGGIESIFSAMALRTAVLPPTLNLKYVDPTMADLDLIPNLAREKQVEHVLCNGFGFGGVNAALILKRYQA